MLAPTTTLAPAKTLVEILNLHAGALEVSRELLDRVRLLLLEDDAECCHRPERPLGTARRVHGLKVDAQAVYRRSRLCLILVPQDRRLHYSGLVPGRLPAQGATIASLKPGFRVDPRRVDFHSLAN